MKCNACKSFIKNGPLFSVTEDSVTKSFCKDCCGELYFNVLPNVTKSKGGCTGPPDETSPWQDNAIRHMEGD